MSFEQIQMEVIRQAEKDGLLAPIDGLDCIIDLKSDLADLATGQVVKNYEMTKTAIGGMLRDLIVYCATQDIDPLMCLKATHKSDIGQ